MKTETRTDQELNRIIAEWMGYKLQPEKLPTHRDPDYEPAFWIDPDDRNTFDIPNYCTDLNDIHEAEKKLIFSKGQRYIKELRIILSHGLDDGLLVVDMVFATARQRAEALVAVTEGDNKTKIDRCPRCSAVGIIKRYHEGGFATPECYWKECETCNYEWDHA
jgi:hypothetical protein